MSSLERKLPDCRKTSYFLEYARNNTSQGGEDGILEKIFSLLGVSNTQEPFCVDIGAWDGKHLSNTYSLLLSNWGGLLIEANEERYLQLAALYAHNNKVTCLSSLVAFSGRSSLPSLLDQYRVQPDFDFLCIDVDGCDYHLWNSLRESNYSPKVVCIEFNPTIANHILFIQEPDMRIHQGCSLLALVELGKAMHYTLVATTTFNAIFVHNTYMSRLPDVDYSLSALHVSSMITDMFQTYDGEIKFVGPKKLLWHRTAINVQRMQVLPPKHRVFPFAPPASVKSNGIETAMVHLIKCFGNGASKNPSSSSISETSMKTTGYSTPIHAFFAASKAAPTPAPTSAAPSSAIQIDMALSQLLLCCREAIVDRTLEGIATDTLLTAVLLLQHLAHRGKAADDMVESTCFQHRQLEFICSIFMGRGDAVLTSDATAAVLWYKKAFFTLPKKCSSAGCHSKSCELIGKICECLTSASDILELHYWLSLCSTQERKRQKYNKKAEHLLENFDIRACNHFENTTTECREVYTKEIFDEMSPLHRSMCRIGEENKFLQTENARLKEQMAKIAEQFQYDRWSNRIALVTVCALGFCCGIVLRKSFN